MTVKKINQRVSKPDKTFKHDSLFCSGSFIPTNMMVSDKKNVEMLEASLGGSRMVIRCIEVENLVAPFTAVNRLEQPLLNTAVRLSELCGEDMNSMKAVVNRNSKTQVTTYYYPVAVLAESL